MDPRRGRCSPRPPASPRVRGGCTYRPRPPDWPCTLAPPPRGRRWLGLGDAPVLPPVSETLRRRRCARPHCRASCTIGSQRSALPAVAGGFGGSTPRARGSSSTSMPGSSCKLVAPRWRGCSDAHERRVAGRVVPSLACRGAGVLCASGPIPSWTAPVREFVLVGLCLPYWPEPAPRWTSTWFPCLAPAPLGRDPGEERRPLGGRSVGAGRRVGYSSLVAVCSGGV